MVSLIVSSPGAYPKSRKSAARRILTVAFDTPLAALFRYAGDPYSPALLRNSRPLSFITT